MGKIAFVFPGQGAQYVGMGKEIIEYYPESKAVFEEAKKVLDFDLEELCFSENDKIHITEYTQPALLAVSIAILKAVEGLGIKPSYVAGLSLGEYSALVANGALNYIDAVELVRKRGQFMEEAAKTTRGSMAAVLGSDAATIEAVCKEVGGVVGIANYNSPSQIVIAGELDSLALAKEKLSGMNIKVIDLSVSGAFHSPLMEAAGNRLEKVLDQIEVHSFDVPYATNVTGKIVESPEDVKSLLVKQVVASVRWEECVKTLISEGVDTFVEIGPGKTLTGLIKKIDRSVKAVNVEDIQTLNKLKDMMEVQ